MEVGKYIEQGCTIDFLSIDKLKNGFVTLSIETIWQTGILSGIYYVSTYKMLLWTAF